MSISSILYPNLNAKLEGMYAKRISKQSLEELLKQNSTKQVVALLKSLSPVFQDLEDNPKRIKIKIFLERNLIEDIQKIARLLNHRDKQVFWDFISIYEIRCIKSAFRKLSSENKIKEESNDIVNWTKHLFRNLQGIEQVENQEEFFNIVKKTRYQKLFGKMIPNKVSIFEMENKLDRFYFEQMMEIAKNYNSALKDMIGRKIDLNNITWIYREKENYDFAKEKIKQTLIDVHYRLKKPELEKLVNCDTKNEMCEILQTTYYAKYVNFREMENLESNIDQYLYRMYQKHFRGNIFDIGVVYAYLNLVELENNDIMNIVEGIRYDLSKDEIRQRLSR